MEVNKIITIFTAISFIIMGLAHFNPEEWLANTKDGGLRKVEA